MDDGFKNQVLERTDIVDLVRSFGVVVRKSGQNYTALCPFHKEKSPSFSLNPGKGFFHCFGCQASGTQIDFVMRHENMDFLGALHFLARRAGVAIPERHSSPQEAAAAQAARSEKQKILELLEDACRYFEGQLRRPEHAAALAYAQSRGLDEEALKKFRVGWAPDSYDAILRWGSALNHPQELLIKAGLLKINEEKRSVYDLFRGRLMFPIWDDEGRVVAFSGRIIVEDKNVGKYINSPESPVFTKSLLLYGYNLARKNMQGEQGALICEGQMDVIACHRAGLSHAVAPLGTALTEEHVRKLRRAAKGATLCFDADPAGLRAAKRSLGLLLGAGLPARVITIPAGKDPDEILRKQGSEALRDAVRNSRDCLDFLAEQLRKEHGDNTSGRAAAGNEAMELLSAIPDPILLSSMLQDIAERLHLDPRALQDGLRKRHAQERSRERRQQTQSPAAPPPPESGAAHAPQGPPPPPEAPPDAESGVELILLQIALASEDLAHELAEVLPAGGLSSNPSGTALNYVLSLVHAGDWAAAAQAALARFKTSPSVMKALAMPEYSASTSQEILRKAAADCLSKRLSLTRERRAREIMNELKRPGADAKALLAELQKLKAMK
ncbi:MAG: primase [Verrucomicrobiota bacterium]|jgi:DNA primase